MNLMHKLAARAEAGRPVRAGLIGAGKFGSMFLAQVPTIPGLDVAVIADLDPDRARQACRRVGWEEQRIARTRFVDSGLDACAADGVEVVIEATGSPMAGISHALAAIEAGRHIVMVNVEADVLAAPCWQPRRASAAWSTRWLTATSRRWWPSWWTGRGRPGSRWRRPASGTKYHYVDGAQ